MTLYATLTSPAVPLFRDDIDADLIIRFCGTERAKARRAPFSQAAILIVGRNFGGGARYGEAVAAMKERGLVIVLGVSFAPAFADRAFAEGVTAIALNEASARALAEEAFSGDALTIDFASERIVTRHGERFQFSLSPVTRARYFSVQREKSFLPEEGGHVLIANRRR